LCILLAFWVLAWAIFLLVVLVVLLISAVAWLVTRRVEEAMRRTWHSWRYCSRWSGTLGASSPPSAHTRHRHRLPVGGGTGRGTNQETYPGLAQLDGYPLLKIDRAARSSPPCC
jgi:hypothetical protein